MAKVGLTAAPTGVAAEGADPAVAVVVATAATRRKMGRSAGIPMSWRRMSRGVSAIAEVATPVAAACGGDVGGSLVFTRPYEALLPRALVAAVVVDDTYMQSIFWR